VKSKQFVCDRCKALVSSFEGWEIRADSDVILVGGPQRLEAGLCPECYKALLVWMGSGQGK
jgi:hypothetical protein